MSESDAVHSGSGEAVLGGLDGLDGLGGQTRVVLCRGCHVELLTCREHRRRKHPEESERVHWEVEGQSDAELRARVGSGADQPCRLLCRLRAMAPPSSASAGAAEAAL